MVELISILLLPLVARYAQGQKMYVYGACLFFMSVVLTVCGSVIMFVVYQPLLKIVFVLALEC